MFEADQWKIILLNWIQKIGIHLHPGKLTSKIRNDPTEKDESSSKPPLLGSMLI